MELQSHSAEELNSKSSLTMCPRIGLDFCGIDVFAEIVRSVSKITAKLSAPIRQLSTTVDFDKIFRIEDFKEIEPDPQQLIIWGPADTHCRRYAYS